MVKIKKRVPIYPMSVVFHSTAESMECGINHPLEEGVGGAVQAIGETIHIFVHHDKDGGVDISHVAHEAFHAADLLCDYVGIATVYNTGNEAIAYLVQWFTDFILEANHKIYKKNNATD